MATNTRSVERAGMWSLRARLAQGGARNPKTPSCPAIKARSYLSQQRRPGHACEARRAMTEWLRQGQGCTRVSRDLPVFNALHPGSRPLRFRV
eukprot:364163-Chlamydomonas_euryale.AAC.20